MGREVILPVVHLLALVLAVWRLTDLMTVDRLTEPLRRRWPVYLWFCPRCMSVWAGCAATAVYLVLPWLNWPFALAWLYLVHTEAIVVRHANRIVIDIRPTGAIELQDCKLTSTQTIQVLTQVMQSVARASQGAA